MIAVRILRSFGLWNAGEIAGFPAERAAELIAGGWVAAVGEAPAVVAPVHPENAPAASRRRPRS